MTEKQFDLITKWQKDTFPAATDLSKLRHLNEEVAELMDAINDEDHLIDHEKTRKTKLEFADCFLLLFGAAKAYGMSYADILKCVDDKMSINIKRTWGKPDSNGVVKHVEN